ncbi:MAG: amidase [Methylibium sp.]|uniref:amidase n=1 Tax=Methylibium sp. TaxID=2067992 RepID=UPI001846D717|nr:amidase [Methylibium sp.]MBA3596151.1 amidase [Methylibium sp.]
MNDAQAQSNRASEDLPPLPSQHRRLLLAGLAGAGAASMGSQVSGCAIAGQASPGPMASAPRGALPGSIAEAGKALRAGAFTSEELTKAYLRAIAESQPKLNAFITVTADQAVAQARRLDQELRAGKDRGRLHGIPIVHKDLFDTAGVATTVGSEFFKGRTPRNDATVVARMAEAGVVSLGKTNMNEFAAGTSGTNAFFGDVHNPWDLARSAGGSSSGTGAAIAAGLCLGGTGSDTGGSIRVPASWNGITGIRPTFGRVSLSGVYPRAYSLDCAGPLARSVADVAALLQAMVGYDPTYKDSVRAPAEDFSSRLAAGIRGLKIGIIDNYTYRDVDPDVVHAVQAAAQVLERLGATVLQVRIPMLAGPLEYSSLFNILLYEFNQILGVEYRATADKNLFGPIVRGNIARGETVSREFYERSLRERAQKKRDFREVFKQVDALITPTMPTVAPVLSASGDTYDRGRQFALPFSWVGVPSISVPCGFGAGGLPIGMQIVGDEMQEALLLRIAAAYEGATPHHRARPPAFTTTRI